LSDVTKIKNNIFTELNSKDDVPAEQLQNSFQTIDEKLQSIESAKHAINEHLEDLRKLSLRVC
jgi:septation ring formation regulator EzrA